MAENIFFAVFPEREAAREIEGRARQLQRTLGIHKEQIEAERLHVSLLGFNIHADRKKLVRIAEQAVSEISIKPFHVAFDHVDTFDNKKGRYPFVLLSDYGSNAALGALRRDLRLALKKNIPGLKPASAGFTPHVTLFYAHRKIDQEYPLKNVIRWRVREFVLVRSLVGESIYVPLRRWKLGA